MFVSGLNSDYQQFTCPIVVARQKTRQLAKVSLRLASASYMKKFSPYFNA